ncbi:MAG: Acyl-CoA thioesterase [Subtercola sp.]|jgi:acyl-CoA thioesterase-2|nr:Acyl-CoA thioesterase [Subtercola sp.]
MTHPSLQSLLTVEPIAPDTFVGQSIPGNHNRIFGGQLIAQAISASGLTVATDRRVVSIQTTFHRPGNSSEPVTYRVSTVRDGRSFSNRRVEALQNDKLIFVADTSFQIDEALPEPEAGAESERLTPFILSKSALTTSMSVADAASSFRSYFDIRTTTAAPSPSDQVLTEDLPTVGVPPSSRQATWFRLRETPPTTGLLNRAIFAYATDFAVARLVARAKQVERRDAGNGGSISQSIWWHLEPNLGEWMLSVQETPHTPGIRGLVFGRIYNSAGSLIASIVQEAFARAGDFSVPARSH